MFSKTTQPTLKNFPSNYSPYDSVACWDSKNPCHSKVMVLSNKCLLLSFSWERILNGQQCYRMYLSHPRCTTSIRRSLVSKCIH